MYKSTFFDEIIKALQKSGDVTLAYYFQHEQMMNELRQRQMYEQMVHDAANEVLSRLSATADVTEIFDKIEGLNKAIENLGKGGN